MSAFIKVLQKHEVELERMLAKRDEGNPVPYSVMRDNGMLKPFAVRLPVHLIAVLDEMVKHGLWESKQEMAYDMIQSAYVDFLSTLPEVSKAKFDGIQKREIDEWTRKNKDKVENMAISTLMRHATFVPLKGKQKRK